MGALLKRFTGQFKWRNIYLECDNSSDFFLSCWQKNVSAVPLLICRSFLFLLNVAIVLASLILTVQYDYIGYWPIYMTHWGLCVNTLASGFGVAVSARCFKYGPIDATFGLPLYVKTYWVLQNIAVTMALLITVFYWSFLTDLTDAEEGEVLFAVDPTLDIFIHSINSVSMFLWLVSARHQTRLYHVVHPILFAVLYLLFTLIYYAAGGTNGMGSTGIYPTLDWADPGFTVIMVLMTTLLVIFIHILVVGMAAGRDALARLYKGDSATVSISGF